MSYAPRRQSPVTIIALFLFTTLAGAATLTCFTPIAHAQIHQLKDVSIKLVVTNPEKDSPGDSNTLDAKARRLKHAEITRLTAKTVEKRLTAAGVKKFQVESKPHGVILVQAHSTMERDALSALITSRGQLDIRPVMQSGNDWQSIVSALPAGIELRQDIESLDAQNAYLWSATHSTLNVFLSQISVPATLFAVYPSDGGWRSLTLGEPVTTQNNLAQAQTKTTPSGVPFISLEFHQAFIRSQNQDMALVLDGEVITIISAKHERAISRIELASPPYLQSRNAQTAWVTQVSGRLAAYLPLLVAELKD